AARELGHRRAPAARLGLRAPPRAVVVAPARADPRERAHAPERAPARRRRREPHPGGPARGGDAMNTPVRRLATVVLVMFLALMVSATWVQFVQAPTLNADQRNVRTLYNEYGNARGPIVVGGESVALSEPVDDVFGYQRLYPEPEVYAPVTGFYSVVFGRTGLEREANDQLTGRADSLFWTRLQDLLTGRRPQGSAVETTILPAAQEAAYEALDGLRGAVVALDPRTGAILAMVSTPSFDPNLL